MTQPDAAAQTVVEVECLGLTFASDEARRAYFLAKLRSGLEELHARLGGVPYTSVEDTLARLRSIRQWPLGSEQQMRETATRMQHSEPGRDLLQRWKDDIGFPHGSIEDILRLSDPPYATACPNPFLADFVRLHQQHSMPTAPCQQQPYHGELHMAQRHPVYAFHPYHTKVPPEIIRCLIEHYTRPGDLVLDSFCGSGMTGVAARECGRRAIVSDLAPVASFISSVNVSTHDWQEAAEQLHAIIAASEQRFGHLYTTQEQGHSLPVNYYVWSDVFICPACACEFPFFPHGVIHHGTKVETRKCFACPCCAATLTVRTIRRVLTSTGKQRVLVWVNAGRGKQRVNRAPLAADLALAREAEALAPEAWFPRDAVDASGYTARLAQLGDKSICDVSCFLTRRNLLVFADLWQRTQAIPDAALRQLCLATLTSIFTVVSERQGYFGGGGGMSGNLYMPIVRTEKNVYATLRRKLRRLDRAERAKQCGTGQAVVSAQSATNLALIPDATIDYIYTDPPFGANIIYSEVNHILEAWLRVTTNNAAEAVIDTTRERDSAAYAALLQHCFGEYFRVLKPGRWLTVEFHNTQAQVWNLIQEAIGASGFVIAQVSMLDKGSTTILADIRPSATRGDLLISAYKPQHAMLDSFRLGTGSSEDVWAFVYAYLQQLPVSLEHDEHIARRNAHMIYNRMVAFYVQQGVAVPISATTFYRELARRFPQCNGLYFLPGQVAAYQDTCCHPPHG
jgi:DNA modification methylase